MASYAARLIALLLMVALGSCVTYSGIAKQDDQVYLAGSTTFLIFSKSWVKVCAETADGLVCEELKVRDVPKPPKPFWID